MAGVTSGGIYFNTESGLTPFLDRLTATLDRDSQQQQQYAGIAPALRATGVPTVQQSGGILANLLPGLFGQQQQQQTAPSTPAAAPTAPASGAPAAGAPTFADVSQNDVARYIGQAAQARGIDPMTAIRVAASEGGFTPGRMGDDNSSAGPFQLHYGGVASGGNKVAGLGDDFTTATGKDARDPANWQAAVDFALDNAAKNGWGAFHGARKAGIDDFAGIPGRGPSAPAADPGTAAPATSPAAGGGAAPMPIATSDPHVAPTTQPNAAGTRAPLGGITPEALGAMIANPASRELGLKLWQQKLTGKDFGFSITPDGTVIRTDKESGTAVPVYQAPVKKGFQEFNGHLLATDPQAGTARDATPAGLPQGYRPATTQERTSYGVGPTTPLFIGPDGKPMTLQGGTNVTVNNAVDPILKGLGDQFVSSAAGARNDAATVRSIQTARSQLNGGMFTGTAANQVLALQKAGQLIGVGDPSKIQNTETFRAAVGPIVLSTVKNLGSGSGITDADREFAEKMAGGNIALDAGSIGRILDIQEKAARSRIDRHNALADSMLKTRPELATSAPMLRIEQPPVATKQVGGKTYTQHTDGNWYVDQ